MVTAEDVRKVAKLADVGIDDSEIIEFTRQCSGVLAYFEILDKLATALRDLHGTDWKRDRFGELLGSAAAVTRFERGDPAGTIVAGWAAEQMEFERRRARHLLYE